MNVLFIYLKAFSSVGGIENFNKCFIKALSDISNSNAKIKLNISSLYDNISEDRYINKKYFFGFNGNKISFVSSVIKQLLHSDLIVLGHINFFLIGLLAIILRKKVIIIAHGIEVWENDSLLKTFFLRKVNLILSVSEFTKNKLIKAHNVNDSKIKIFHNTLDPFYTNKYINNNKLEIIEKKNIILSVSRLNKEEKYKGYDTVIRCMPEIKREFGEVYYIIAGKADSSEIERLNVLIKEVGQQGNVMITGEISEEEIVRYYNSANVFVLPSKGEGFGIVFLEAIYFGLPVVAGNKDGSSEPLLNGKLGKLIDPDNLKEISSAIIYFLSEKKYHKMQFRQESRKNVLEYFGYNVFLKKSTRYNILYYLTIYFNL